MPDYRYESRTATGDVRSGVITAPDRAEVVRQLLGRGEMATIVVPDGTAGNGAAAARAARAPRPASTPARPAPAPAARPRRAWRTARPTLSRSEMANLVRELATALEAGLPLMQALRTIRRQASGRGMPLILDHLIERVEAGDPLHAAAREYGPPFDDMVLGMLRAADASGRMSEVLHQLADLLERSLELRREVMGATLYPLIVAVLIAASATVLVTVLVPKLIEPLAGEIVLPWPTKALLGAANFLSSWWLLMVLAVGGAWIGWRAWTNVPANRVRVDRALLKIPVMGQLLRDVAVARFTRTLGTLTSAGLPLLESLRITQHTLVNAAMMQALDQVQDQVTAGKALADPLEHSGLFPPLLVQVVNLGERSGKLESMLLHAATAFDRQVNASMKLFTKALPPLLLIVMASLGGFVLAAILLPLLELQSLVG